MEYLNTPSFISVITNIINNSPHGQTFKDDLIPFLRQRVRDEVPADSHCSIDSGCKSPVVVDIEETGFALAIKYIQLDVPDENYLPDNFVVGTNPDGVHFVLTKPFEVGQHRWNGFVIRSNLTEDGRGPFHFQVPIYDDALINEVIGIGVGEGVVGAANSLSPQPPTSPQHVLPDSLFGTSTSGSVPRPDDEVGRAEPSTLPPPPADRPGIIATGLGYVGRLFKYLTNSLTSPKMGRSNPVNIITPAFDFETVLSREDLGGRGRGGGRGTRKLFKRTTKPKKSYYLRNKVTCRGRGRGRGRGRSRRTRKN